MTQTGQKKRRGVRVDRYLFLFVSVLLIGLFIKNAAEASNYVRGALALCAETVVPSIFPCTVASGIFVALGGGGFLGRALGRPMRFLFGLSGNGAAVLLLGWFCGFPVGAVTGATLLRRGELERGELDSLLLFSGIPSPAFVISAVGENLLGDRRLGLLLWLSCLASSVAVGAVTRKKGASPEVAPTYSLPPLDAKIFTAAIAKATAAMLSITAYVVFFAAVIGTLAQVLASFALPDVFRSLLFCFFELSSGVNAAATLESHALSVLLCALAVGWSGLSIHCQLLTLCDGRDLSFRFYFRARAVEAILCAAIAMILAPFCF
jgi:hypothetical protein